MEWVIENWLTTLNAVGIIGGLLFTAFSLHSEAETRRVANILTITANHRSLWKQCFKYPALKRVLDPVVDLKKERVTTDESIFVNMVILHTSSMFEALKDKLVSEQEGLRKDVASFFSLPIPQAVWEKIKVFQNRDFVAFVEECRRGGIRLKGSLVVARSRKKSRTRRILRKRTVRSGNVVHVSIQFPVVHSE